MMKFFAWMVKKRLRHERAAGDTYAYGNRKAKGNRYIMRLDSLINVYGDLPECGEVAIERYNVMRECNDVSAAEKAEYIKTALDRWAAWRNIPQLKSRYEELIQPSFRAEVKDMILPERTDSMWLTVRNMREIKVSVTRLKLSGNTDLVATMHAVYISLPTRMLLLGFTAALSPEISTA